MRCAASTAGSFGDVYLKGAFQWQVSYFTLGGKKEIGLVIINDVSGHVVEQWTGFQVAWTMARGYPGAFGRHVNALYIWLPLCVLFVLPFINFRRPFSLLHLDLLVLLLFSVSLAFFNHAHIYASVPLAYPPLLYLLARMLALLRRPRARAGGSGRRAPAQLRLLVSPRWLALGVVFLIGFRIALNVTDSNVIDVGYAGVIGAQRLTTGKPMYGDFPSDNERGDTYGPVNYEAYVPFEQIFGWSGKWDDLPAAHAAAIFFDLLATALLFLIGRRMRGPTLGIVFAYAWVSYPFTLFALESNSNDSLVGALVLAAVLAASYRSQLALAGRGALTALAGMTKFAPLALAPLFATHGLSETPREERGRALAFYALTFLATIVLVSLPMLAHNSLHTFYERTIAYQSDRESPFSVWGLYGWHGAELAVELVRRGARTGARGGASAPRRRRPRGRLRGRDHRRAARNRTLVLPVHPVVLPARDRRAAGAAHRSCGPAAGRGISTCSIESARSGCEQLISTPISHGSSSEVSKRTGIIVSSDSIACSRLTPITPPRGPVIPTSVMYAVPPGSTRASAVGTCVCVPTTAVTRPSRCQPIATFSEVASACMSTRMWSASASSPSATSISVNAERPARR